MSGDFEAWLEFRAGESGRGIWSTPKLICCDCGKPAQGNASCDDGELCDACVAEASAAAG